MKQSRHFFSSIGLLVVLNFIIKPVWVFGIDRQVQNQTGHEAYGTYFSLLGLSVVFSFLLDWGITAFYNRQLATGKNDYASLASGFLMTKLLFAGFYVLVVFTVSWFTGIQHWDVLCGTLLVQILSSLFLFFRGILTARQWFREDAWLSVLDKALLIILCFPFLYIPGWAGSLNIMKFLLLQAACFTAAILVAVIVLRKKGFRFSMQGTALPAAPLFRAAFPYALIVLLMSAHNRLDVFLLERMQGEYAAGIYAGAYRLLDMANMAGYLAASFLLPFIAARYSTGRPLQAEVLMIRHMLLLFSIFVAISVFFLAPWIQQLLYHNQDAAAVEVMQYCLPALLGYSLVQVYGTILTATGHILLFCKIAAGAVMLNSCLNLLLISGWGSLGCCMAAFTSQIGFGIACQTAVQKKCRVAQNSRSLLLYVLMALLLSCFFYLAAVVQWPPLLQLTVAAVFSIVLLFVTKLFRISWLKGLVQEPRTL